MFRKLSVKACDIGINAYFGRWGPAHQWIGQQIPYKHSCQLQSTTRSFKVTSFGPISRDLFRASVWPPFGMLDSKKTLWDWLFWWMIGMSPTYNHWNQPGNTGNLFFLVSLVACPLWIPQKVSTSVSLPRLRNLKRVFTSCGFWVKSLRSLDFKIYYPVIFEESGDPASAPRNLSSRASQTP